MQEEVPIWIPGSGSPETWDVVNDNDYCYGYLSFSGKKAAVTYEPAALPDGTLAGARPGSGAVRRSL